jgi:perosamine synthetase
MIRPDLQMSSPDINEDDIAAVVAVLRSGNLSIGPRIEEFERDFAAFVGTRHAVAVSNGTSALHLCMRLAGLDKGSEVITSSFSFVASANCIAFEQAMPVFVDIDETTLNIDPRLVADAITERTRAILPIHVFGQPADMDPLIALAEANSLTVVEDACEAIGAEYNSKKVGTFGKAAVFAFYPNKQMTTGEGAVIVTDDSDWDMQLRSLRNQGRSAMGGWLSHDRLGFNYRLNEMSAALGVSQLARVEILLGRRSRVAERYNEEVSRIRGVRSLALAPSTTKMSWFVYPVLLESGFDRDAIAAELTQMGVPNRNYFPPIHLQPYYRETYGFRQGQFPITERIASSTIALPFHGKMTDGEISQVCDALGEAIGSAVRRR